MKLLRWLRQMVNHLLFIMFELVHIPQNDIFENNLLETSEKIT